LLLLTACSRREPPAAAPAEVEAALKARVVAWLDNNALARADGFIYAVDVGQLMCYAVRCGDRKLYERLREEANLFVVDREDDPFTRGFVAWRRSATKGEPFDASGTTEALRIAEAYWRGGGLFDIAADRERAVMILRGYARHQGTDQGVWFICNYFNFGTRGFATNTFLVDYDPDFVREVAEATGDEALRDVARKSLELVRGAEAPCGLIYDMVQPEVLTLMPDFDHAAFSPNDVVQLSNSATVAERCVRGEPALARSVLRFAAMRRHKLPTRFFGRTGEPVKGKDGEPGRAGPETYAVLVRLASAVGDAEAKKLWMEKLLPQAAAFAENPGEPRLYTASEVLLGLSAGR